MKLPVPVNPTKEQMQALLDDFHQWFVVEGHPRGIKEMLWGTSTCVYRGDNGLACAIGRHIPDEVYVEELEGCNASDVINYINGMIEVTELRQSSLRIRFYEDFQDLHDHFLGEDNENGYFEDGLAAFCEKYDLINPATR